MKTPMNAAEIVKRLDTIPDEPIYAFRAGADLVWEAQRPMEMASSHSLGFIQRYEGGEAGSDLWISTGEIRERVAKLGVDGPLQCRFWNGNEMQSCFVVDICPFGESHAMLIAC